MSIPKPDSLHHPQPEDGRSMFEDISDGYFECDLQGSITFCNSALSDLLGCSREEMTGIGHHSYLDRANAEIVMRGLRDFLEGALSVPDTNLQRRAHPAMRRLTRRAITSEANSAATEMAIEISVSRSAPASPPGTWVKV